VNEDLHEELAVIAHEQIQPRPQPAERPRSTPMVSINVHVARLCVMPRPRGRGRLWPWIVVAVVLIGTVVVTAADIQKRLDAAGCRLASGLNAFQTLMDSAVQVTNLLSKTANFGAWCQTRRSRRSAARARVSRCSVSLFPAISRYFPAPLGSDRPGVQQQHAGTERRVSFVPEREGPATGLRLRPSVVGHSEGHAAVPRGAWASSGFCCHPWRHASGFWSLGPAIHGRAFGRPRGRVASCTVFDCGGGTPSMARRFRPPVARPGHPWPGIRQATRQCRVSGLPHPLGWCLAWSCLSCSRATRV
jgi:hypothetical protein